MGQDYQVIEPFLMRDPDKSLPLIMFNLALLYFVRHTNLACFAL